MWQKHANWYGESWRYLITWLQTKVRGSVVKKLCLISFVCKFVRFFFFLLRCFMCLSVDWSAKTISNPCVPLPAGYRTSPPRPSAWATWRGSSTSSSGAWAWPCWWPSSNSATSHATRPKEWRWRPSPNPSPNTPNTTNLTVTATPARQAAPAIAPSLAKARVPSPAPPSTT